MAAQGKDPAKILPEYLPELSTVQCGFAFLSIFVPFLVVKQKDMKAFEYSGKIKDKGNISFIWGIMMIK